MKENYEAICVFLEKKVDGKYRRKELGYRFRTHPQAHGFATARHVSHDIYREDPGAAKKARRTA